MLVALTALYVPYTDIDVFSIIKATYKISEKYKEHEWIHVSFLISLRNGEILQNGEMLLLFLL